MKFSGEKNSVLSIYLKLEIYVEFTFIKFHSLTRTISLKSWSVRLSIRVLFTKN